MRFDDSHRLTLELNKFFSEQMGLKGANKVHVIDDLIVLRCGDALSPAELEIGAIKAGRLLVKEVCEKACRELRPGLDRLLRDITGTELLEVRVDLFWRRREKVFLFSMSEKLNPKRIKGEYT